MEDLEHGIVRRAQATLEPGGADDHVRLMLDVVLLGLGVVMGRARLVSHGVVRGRPLLVHGRVLLLVEPHRWT